MAADGWEAIIGLEVHAQLRTRAKLFSSAPNCFGGEPNTHTTEVDLGLPGVLPVINERAVELAVRAALALGCDIQPVSIFARKHYFYPDLPKGYQISQYEEPYALGGSVPIELDGKSQAVALTRIHMEEDAAKSIHEDTGSGGGATHVNLNRAGVPLIEIVSEPVMTSPEEAGAYLRSLRSILRYLDVSDGDMEKGNFRCDANVSVRRRGESELGTRVELKNLNSFRFVEKALAYEIERQIDLIESGGAVEQETRSWDDREDRSKPQRSKEDAEDYRYFPDPDLPPLKLGPEVLERVRASLPELPHAKRGRFRAELGLSERDARVLTEDRDVAEFFESAARAARDPKKVANWVMRDVLGAVAEQGLALADLPLAPDHLVELLALIDSGSLTVASARKVFAIVAGSGERPEAVMQAQGLGAVSDRGELESHARSVLESNPEQVEQYRGGEQKVFNFFVGQVMRATRGQGDPEALREILTRLLAD